MADPDPSDTNKAHNAAHSGRKAEKKKAKRSFNTEMDPRKRNPKAFAIQSVNKAEKRFRRTMDIKSKKLRLPEVSRIPVNPPPAVVAVVGPPQVGKTTLMQCMIKSFTRQNLSSVKGPVTVVSGKKKRLTLIECSNDINSMIDIAKVADLVLLLIDAKSGFEMETFEFLNICQVHGMPRIMGVLTHLDLFKNKKVLQRTKTLIKKRYRTEIPRAEKMFHFSGLLHGEYLRNEVHNLTRFISVMIFEPSSWQKSHPYIFADRIEDITNPEQLLRDQTCDRTVCLYGYARGGALKKNTSFHIPGCGDYVIKNMHFLPDPCPLPDKEKRRSLNQKERLIYAPMSGVGGIVYDKDAVYIELRGSHSHIQNQEDSDKPSEKLMSSLITTQHPIDTKMAATELSLFSGADPLTGSFEEEENIVKERSVKNQDDGSDKQDTLDMQSGYDSGDFSDNDESDESFDSSREENSNLQKKKVTFSSNDFSKPSKEAGMFPKEITGIFSGASEEDSEDSSAEIGHVKWKEHLKQKAANSFYKRQQNSVNIQKLVYGNKKFLKRKPGNSDSDEEELGGLFHVAKHEKEKKNNQNCNALDCSKFHLEVSRDWSIDGEVDSIKDCFVTGKWHDTEDAENLLKEDDELFGDFEDYEADKEKSVDSVIQSEDENEIEEESSKENDFSITTECKEKTLTEKRMAKKLKLKELFNSQLEGQSGQSYHDELKMEVDEQTELNRKEFEDLDDEIRVQYEGYRPGLYLRLEVEQMPCEFVNNFDPSYPIIVGSLLKGEDKMGYVQVRLKKHRWYPRILKSRDPLIISLGWRRFQTIPLYFIQDHNFRNRHLKYTPKHLHCLASFWGPITAQKSGILALQSVSEVVSNFRIAAVGTVLELNRTTDIVKKLKLIGTPMEIFRKTAFIEGMFHSAMEVAKYEGAAIRTVSGIRGQIKKSLRKPPGVFRATFEDKILKSDIVFLRTWVKVTVPQFCSIIHSLLLPLRQKDKWQGMKTSGQLRYERGLHAPVSKDSLYIPIERKLRQFTPLVVPRNIQKNLPFRDKVIHTPKSLKTERVAVIREPHEREVTKLLDRMKLIHKYKTQKANRAMWLRARAHKKEKRKEEAIHHQKLQAKKKRMLMRRNPTTR